MKEVNPIGRKNQVEVVVAWLVLLEYHISASFCDLSIILKWDKVSCRTENWLHVSIQVVVLSRINTYRTYSITNRWIVDVKLRLREELGFWAAPDVACLGLEIISSEVRRLSLGC